MSLISICMLHDSDAPHIIIIIELLTFELTI